MGKLASVLAIFLDEDIWYTQQHYRALKSTKMSPCLSSTILVRLRGKMCVGE
jgi:hypothetical protein